MSLQLALDSCEGRVTLPNFPYSKQILENKFDPTEYSLDKLLDSLLTYSYLGIDSTNTVKEIVWRLGENKELFHKFFKKVGTEHNTSHPIYGDRYYNRTMQKSLIYSVREDINKIHYCEIKRVYPKKHTQEELSVRFLEYTTCMFIAKYGNFRLLKSVSNHKLLDSWTFLFAAECGNFEMVKWLHENKCKYDEFVCDYAAHNGHFKILKWAIQHEFQISGHALQYAAKNGHFEILKWLINLNMQYNFYSPLTSYAAIGNNFEILKWLVEQKYLVNAETFANAVLSNNFEMVKWLKQKNCPWNYNVTTCAVKVNNFDILKWAISFGCPVNEFAANMTGVTGNLEILLWLISKGCSYDSSILSNAVCNNHQNMIDWAIKKNMSLNELQKSDIVDHAIKKDDIRPLKWLHDNYKMPHNICEIMFKNRRYKMLFWALDNDYEWPQSDFIDAIKEKLEKVE